MFPSLAARETYAAETSLLLGNKKCICLESKTFLLPGHKFCFRNMFPSLATMKTMLTRFQCRSLSKNCLLSVLKTIKMADCEEIEAGYAQSV